jgi:hypothetical protein
MPEGTGFSLEGRDVGAPQSGDELRVTFAGDAAGSLQWSRSFAGSAFTSIPGSTVRASERASACEPGSAR